MQISGVNGATFTGGKVISSPSGTTYNITPSIQVLNYEITQEDADLAVIPEIYPIEGTAFDTVISVVYNFSNDNNSQCSWYHIVDGEEEFLIADPQRGMSAGDTVTVVYITE